MSRSRGWLLAGLLLVFVSSLGGTVAAGRAEDQFAAPPAQGTTTDTPTDTPTPSATATFTPIPTNTLVPITISFTVDSSSIQYGTCTYLRWSVSGTQIQAVYLDGLQVATSGNRQICPPQTTTYSLQAIFPGGSQEALRQVQVRPRALSPTPTRTLTPSPTPLRTPTWTPVVALPTPTRPGGAFPPPSLNPSPTPWPTPLLVPSPTLPAIEPATPVPALATPTPDLSQLAPPAALPEGEGRRTRPTPRAVPRVAGGRQDILRLLAFGVIGVVGAAVLGVISLLLWKRD